ncbi:MAG: methyltransferase domain-containing protein [Arcobacter sp.]|jgi:SAM-dependent methyltransferase|uniref:Tellurite resistance protein TehB n=1 Tax=Arcobacter defluvii TaxID=873191 RepID=A0AAE7E4Z4_9BACT|nr:MULTISPECIES: methyltransferase domain-containing protein [Arcobacter]MDY3200258.1 methyltransferase domain-containing protein [Arcobacter sp.]QKF76280.1 putative tellurite resistance protein TehB [Arcobacter defluvii]RXI30962.1 tellurium resistance protein [Arcobacter defluvii]
MSQKEFWNSKFSTEEFFYGLHPNEFLASHLETFKEHKKMLCLGEGEGRNAIFFAKKGFEITAIDASDIGLSKLAKRAEEEKLNIKTVCLDLNHWEVTEKYDVIMASYLHMYKNEREILFKKIEDSLNKNGYFVGEFFSTKQLTYNSGGPKDLDLLYTVEDFLNHFDSCKKEVVEELIVLDEGKGHQGEACVIRVVIQKI